VQEEIDFGGIMRLRHSPTRLAVLLALALVLIAAVNSRAFNLDSLLVQSVGGPEAVEKLRTAQSYYEIGSVSNNGHPGRYEHCLVPPDKWRSEMVVGPLKEVEVYDGSAAWLEDQGGAVNSIEGFEQREIQETVWMQAYAFLFKDRCPGGAEYLGICEREGRRYHTVAFYPFNQDTVRVYFDTATTRAELSVSRTDNLESVTRYADYRSVEGVQVPFRVTTVLTGAGLTTEYRVETVRYDSTIAESVLTRSVGAVSDFRFPTQSDSVQIPFASRGHIFVPVTINGKKYRFILDCGASTHLISSAIVKDCGLQVTGNMPVRLVDKYADVGFVKVDSIAVGEIVLLSQVAAVGDLPVQSPVADEPVGGLLGYDFLSRFPVLVDFSNKRLTVYNPRTFKSAEGGTEVPFFLTDRVPTIHATLDDVPGVFLIDLGNPGGLIVHAGWYEAQGLAERRGEAKGQTTGAIAGSGGVIATTAGVKSDFVFGSIIMRDLPIMVIASASNTGVGGSLEWAGNIGAGLLRQYRVLFDYAGSRLILYPKLAAGN
jgi:predicted aspartyl protease